MATKALRVCRLCGRPFHSNKKLYCDILHCRLWNHIRRGTPPLNAVLETLVQRGDIGARLDGYWRYTLLEINWIKPSRDAGDSDYMVLSDWGKEKLKELDKERSRNSVG